MGWKGGKFSAPPPRTQNEETENHIKARVISSYQPMGRTCGCMRNNPRDMIIFHVHGGGFIAQSPLSHVDYLHQWSKQLNVPILSIDYSLAPESPYPRAVEEVFYSYIWMLENCHQLGWTGDRVIVSGDSAGGNLVTGLVLQCIIHDIRIPDGLHVSYACLLAQFYPSPSRLLMMMDPLLMVGILGKCINAYKDSNYLDSLPRSMDDELRLGTSEDDILLSPLMAGPELLRHFPPTLMIETDMDACLDENVQFRSHLEAEGVRAQMEVIKGLPHGFLAFCNMSKDCQVGVETVTNLLREFISTI